MDPTLVQGTDITGILYPQTQQPLQKISLDTVIPDIREKEEDYLITTVIAFIVGSNWTNTITEIIDKKYTTDSQNIKAKVLFTLGITIVGLIIIKKINKANGAKTSQNKRPRK